MKLNEEELKEKISASISGMKAYNPSELENVKKIIKKNVPFFSRSALLAYLLVSGTPSKSRVPNRKIEIPEGADTVFIGVGRMNKLYPNELSKLLKEQLGIASDDILMLAVHDKCSFVTMKKELCEKAIEKLNGTNIKGRIVKVAPAARK